MSGFRSANIKITLLAAAFLFVAGTLFYSQSIVEELQSIVHQLLRDEKNIAQLYAKTIEHVANTESPGTDFSFFFDDIISTIDFPMIETDASDTVINAYRNISLDTLLSEKEKKEHLRNLVRIMDAANNSIKVAYQDSIVLSKIHYSESKMILELRLMITRLRQLPYIEIGLGAMFVLLAYIGFSYIKRSEQSNIWVGMSKETAHQLGTPLSSLMGWIELLKSQLQDESGKPLHPHTMESIEEMENDLSRLQKVAERFSKIGSKPNLKEENIVAIVQQTISYFEKRIATSKRFGAGKQISFDILTRGEMNVRINKELIGWVLENLVKNALDAIEAKEGKIIFEIIGRQKNVFLDVTDTGKGIDSEHRRDIFRPGYSTKERGWGLGLSLCKRIIEQHHKGKLELKETKPGKGTTFRIKLPK
ncbi:MAG: HAMP domain-containing sensor histidine kinase [Bacteroidota bacterium]